MANIRNKLNHHQDSFIMQLHDQNILFLSSVVQQEGFVLV